MIYKDNWDETKERFDSWWNRSSIGRPMMRVIAKRKSPTAELEKESSFETPMDLHLNATELVKRYRNFCKTHSFFAESFPNLDLNLGAGSIAVYLGSEPNFAWDTIWFKKAITDYHEYGSIMYDPNNKWWKFHLDTINRAVELSCGDFLINIPDLIENVDILSALRGPQDFCFDLMDEPELVKYYVNQLDEIYFTYYDTMYDIVKSTDGSSSYTAFSIWGSGRTAKVQCDFSAMMSPTQFREFVQPSLIKQCKQLDHSLYHLDGPDAIRHLDAILEIEDLDALQWTPGAGRPDAGDERWYPIYDKVKAAGKSLWILLSDGDISKWVYNADRLVKRYGSDGLYLLFPAMEEEEAITLMQIAEKGWH